MHWQGHAIIRHMHDHTTHGVQQIGNVIHAKTRVATWSWFGPFCLMDSMMCFIASIQTAIMLVGLFMVGVGELVFMEGISLSRLDQSLYTRVYFFISIFLDVASCARHAK
jgi:hypothetical protein